jgi:hypothetical protein
MKRAKRAIKLAVDTETLVALASSKKYILEVRGLEGNPKP